VRETGDRWIEPPGHVWLKIGSCDFSSETGATVAFGEAEVVAGTERVFISLGCLLVVNLHVAAELGRVGFWQILPGGPDGVVSGQLGQLSEDCVMDEIDLDE